TDKYEFGEAGRYLYNFIWDELCDWYIEMAKLPLYGDDEAKKKTTRSDLTYVFDQTMRMLHPFMPFITEEIWQKLPHKGESMTEDQWPEVQEEYHDEDAANIMESVNAIIKAVSNIRAEVDKLMSSEIKLLIQAKNDEFVEELKNERAYLERIYNPSELVIAT